MYIQIHSTIQIFFSTHILIIGDSRMVLPVHNYCMVKMVILITYQFPCGRVYLFVLGISHVDVYHIIYRIRSLII